MSMLKFNWKAVPIVFFLLLSFFLWRGLGLKPRDLPSAQIGKTVPNFTLPVLDAPQLLFSSKQFRGKTILLNVWASWCAACVEEQVFLLELARQKIPIYGLNYKDHNQSASQWLQRWGNPYQVVISDSLGQAALDLGVYGAPETFLLDKRGIIRYRHVGIVTRNLWENEIKPLFQQLEA